MARKTREEQLVPGCPNHLILRGNNRRRMFSYPRDYRTFIRLLDFANLKTGCELHALCLMPNHVHQLTTPPTVEAASECVASFAQRYAQIRNANRSGSGKLFEERFRSKPIADDAHLMAATMYIEANPIRAGLVRSAAEYRWSTYALHAGVDRNSLLASMWTPSSWYLSLGASSSEREGAYRELFADYVARPPADDDPFDYLDVPYRRRLLRPNGSRAAEGRAPRFVRFRGDRK
jgi:putative transposase